MLNHVEITFPNNFLLLKQIFKCTINRKVKNTVYCVTNSYFLANTCNTFKFMTYISFIFRYKSFKWIIEKAAKNQYLFLWLRSQVKTTSRSGMKNSLANLNSLQIPVGRLWERRGKEQIYIKHNIICSINNLSNV